MTTISRPDEEQYHRHDYGKHGAWGELHQCSCGQWFLRVGDERWWGDRYWQQITDRKAKRIAKRYARAEAKLEAKWKAKP